MAKSLFRCIFAALAACLLFSCSGTEKETMPTRRVVLMYGAAYSNLSANIAEDINELCSGNIPFVSGSDILLVYAHTTGSNSDYNTPTSPVLFRAFRDMEGKLRRDTISVYPTTDVSSTAEVLNKVLTEVKDRFPARGYGLIFSSHGRGWLPVNYSEPSYVLSSVPGENKDFPPTKWLGIEAANGSGIDIRDLADAIPMKLDFCIMDACLMGCVEVAYELREKCSVFISSPTEILTNGFIYTTMAAHLMGLQDPELQSVCREYYEFYAAQSGSYRSATVVMVDCTRLEVLASVCSQLISAHRTELDNINRNSVQRYFYSSSDLHWFYDLRDILAKAGASDSELSTLDRALAVCVPYYAATDYFFDLKLENVCGLSMYLPYQKKDDLNNYYKTLSWNKATGLIQ